MSNSDRRTGRDVRISGVSTLSEVNARTFGASGAATVDGPVTAELVDVSGSAAVRGDVETIDFESTGSADVDGAFDAKRADVTGAFDVRGRARIRTFDLRGSAEFVELRGGEIANGGSLEAETVEAGTVSSSGVLEADRLVSDEVSTSGVLEAGTVEAGRFESSGALEIDALRADEVRIRIGNADAVVDEIEGVDVRIERARNRGDGLLAKFREPGEFVGERVSGETVSVEHARIDVVEGEDVVLGPGAAVGTLRAADAEVDPDATVGSREPLDEE